MTGGYLIDTDWVIHHLNGHPKIAKRLDGLKTQDLAIPLITLAELYDGIYVSRDPAGSELSLLEFLNDVRLVGLDEETARLFAKERGRLRVAGSVIGDFDLLIGVTAIQNGLTLLTNNRRHFERIDGLSIESCRNNSPSSGVCLR
jgi:tRNA(fMet)-specific endonuclease VapC